MKKYPPNENLIWFEIKARYEFLWILILLLGCGYLSSPNLITYLFMLIVFGINSVNTSLYNLSLEKIKALSEMDDTALEKEITKIQKASEILETYRRRVEVSENSINSDELQKLKGVIDESLQQANSISQNRVNERLQFEDWARKERIKFGYRSGSPPIEYSDGSIFCPAPYPIRATRKLRRYYLQNERAGMQGIHWCFPTQESAMKEGFTRPKGDRKQPEVQPKSRKKKSK